MSQKPKIPTRARSPGKPRKPRAEGLSATTVEQLAAEQGVMPVGDPRSLCGKFWPRDEGADEFLDWLRGVRHEPGRDI